MNKQMRCRLAVALLVMAMLLAGCTPQAAQPSYEKEQTLFSLAAPAAVERYCQEHSLRWATENGYHVVYDAACFDKPTQLFYGFNDMQELESVTAYMLLYGYENGKVPAYTARELQEQLTAVLENLCKMHGTELQDSFYIIAYDNWKQLDVADDASYQQIIDNEAYLEFTLLDAQNCFWNVTSQLLPDNVMFLVAEKSYSHDADVVPNITVE